MKKEKKKGPVKLLSRRRLAVRRILIAAAVYVLITHLTVVGVLFPRQGLYVNEELMGAGHGRVVARDWTPEFYWNMLVYLSENENATMLSGTRLTYLGWMDAFGVPVDCSKEQPVYGGYWYLSRSEKNRRMLYFFGRVDDPEITAVEVQAQYEVYEDGKARRMMAFSAYTPQDEWMEKEGRRYFLIRSWPLEWPYESSMYPVLIGYGENGTEITRMELEEGTYSYFN